MAVVDLATNLMPLITRLCSHLSGFLQQEIDLQRCFFFLKEPPAKQGEGPWDSVGSLCRHPHPCPSCRSVRATHGHVQVFTLLWACNHNPDSPEVPQLLLFSSQKLPSFSPEEALEHFEHRFEEPSEFPPQEGTVKLFPRANPKAGSVVFISVWRLSGACFLQKGSVKRCRKLSKQTKNSNKPACNTSCPCEGCSAAFLPLLPQLEKDPLVPNLSITLLALVPQWHKYKRWKKDEVLKCNCLSYSHSYASFLLTSLASGGSKMQLFPFYMNGTMHSWVVQGKVYVAENNNAFLFFPKIAKGYHDPVRNPVQFFWCQTEKPII